MSPSSSANKVARVAARGGGTGRPAGSAPSSQKSWLFPLAIIVILALGLAIVVFARSQTVGTGGNSIKPRAQTGDGNPADHWHAAFAMNVCGTELPPLAEFESPRGIHTHGDGLIHIHPYEISAAGKRATVGRYLSDAGIEVNNRAFHIKGSDKKYEAGKTTCNGKPTELVLAYWKRGVTAESTPPTEVLHRDFGKERFTGDLSAFTLALVPKGTKDADIPPPSTSAQVAALGTCDGPNPDPTICGGASPAGGAPVPGGPGSGGASQGSGQ